MAIQTTSSAHVHFCPYSPVGKGNPANKQKGGFKGIHLQLFHPKNKTHVSCLKQPIPIANARDGALPVCLWAAWLTLLFWQEEVCVYRGTRCWFHWSVTGEAKRWWRLHLIVAQVDRERAQGSPQIWIQRGHCFSSPCPQVHADISHKIT